MANNPVLELTNRLNALDERLSKAQHNGTDPRTAFGFADGQAPSFVRQIGHKPYRLYKAMGVVLGQDPNTAPLEMDCNAKIRKAMQDTGAGMHQFQSNSIIYPF